MFIGFEKICAIAHRRQVLDLLPENSTGFDRPSSTDKAKHFANSRIHRYPDPAFGFFLATKLQSSSTSMKEQALVCSVFAGSAWAACSSQQESFVMHPENSANGSEPQFFEV